MAVSDENGFKDVDVSKIESASIYQDVNREIYEKGGVALTDAAMRAKATANEATPAFELSTLGIVLWSSTAAAGVAAAGSAAAWTKITAPEKSEILKRLDTLRENEFKAWNDYSLNSGIHPTKPELAAQHKQYLAQLEKTANQAGSDYNTLAASSEYEEAKANFDEAQRQYTIKSNVCKYLSVGFALIGAVLAALSIYTTVTEMMAYYKVDFVPIPKYIVDRADITATNSKGETVMIKNQTAYYKSVLCNRTDGSSDLEKKNHEILKDRNDLNGDVGMQWLSLYSVKYENGMPILADSLKVKMGKGDIPEGYTTGIHRFGENNAFNLTSKLYCYNDPNDGTYVYFKNDTATVKDLSTTGSAFSGGSLALGTVIGLILGGVVTFAIVTIINKTKKKKEQAQA